MNRICRVAFAAVVLACVMWGTAAAERTFSVNSNNTGVFDQPSAAVSGNTVFIAFIGDTTASGTYRVFFAAVDGAADFSNFSLPDSAFLIIPPVVIDNTNYFDARHPKIAMRSATEAVILFQARRIPTEDFYRPYIAQIGIANNTVTSVSVQEIKGFPAGVLTDGDIEDISYNLVLADDTARIAFASRATISATTPFHVYFARVGLDSALVVGTPLLLSSGNNNTVTGSDGFRPVPSLHLDPLNNAHVAWAANDNVSNPGGVYYAMVTTFPALDNVGIGATQIPFATLSWGHPSVLAAATNSIIILAADESIPGSAGSIGIVNINPDAAVKNGQPVLIATNRSFLTIGPVVLPSTFDLYRPEAFRDGNGNIHVTGYGNSGTTAFYYAFQLTAAFPFASFATPPISVGFNEFPAELDGDYTKAAFGVFPGRTVIFWSGLISGSSNRNLNFTAASNGFFFPAEEKGCSMVKHPRAGETGRIPGTLLLFLPAAALAIRRISMGIRRNPRRSVAG